LLHTGLISSSILSPDVPRVNWELKKPSDQPCTADAGGKTSLSQQRMWGQYQPTPVMTWLGFLFEPEIVGVEE